jgi:hypothetical protein
MLKEMANMIKKIRCDVEEGCSVYPAKVLAHMSCSIIWHLDRVFRRIGVVINAMSCNTVHEIAFLGKESGCSV